MQSFSINRNRAGQVFALLVTGLAAMVIWTWLAGVGELLAFGPQLKPMSPGAALLSLLFGSMLYFYYRNSKQPIVICIGFIIGGLLTAVSGLVCLRFWLGWGSPVERWLTEGAGRLGHFSAGYISPACGVILLVAAVALLLRLPSRRSSRWMSLGLAIVVVMAGLWVVASYTVGLKWISGFSLNRISLMGGVSFILMGCALFGKDSEQRQSSGTMPAITAAGLALVIGIVGAIGMRHLQAQERVAAHQLLKSVSDLKVEEISNWRRERLDDAITVGAAPMVGHDLQVFLAEPGSATARADLLRWLNLLIDPHRYAMVEVFDTNGVRRLSIPDNPIGPDAEARAHIATTLRTREVVVQDFHRGINTTKVYLDLAVAVCDAGKPVGVVRLVIDPRQLLYSILHALPLPQQSAESALFRVEGREIVALSDLRWQTNTVLNLRMPLDPTSRAPAVKAALGFVGEIEGVDYRNMPVLASVRKIPDSPWYFLTKVDCAEIYAPINQHAWLVLGLTVLMTALVGILAESFWERKRLVLSERVNHLMNQANDVILLHDEYLHILEANTRALELYGYSLAELRAMPSAIDLRAQACRADYHVQTDPLFLNDQAVYESVHQRKDGTTFPVEISSRVVSIVGKRYVFSIIRDLTHRKAEEKKVLQLSRYYNTLSQINQSIIRLHSRKELFRKVCQLAVEHGGFKAARIGWVNRETQAVVTAAVAGESQEFFERVRFYADDRPEGRDTIGTSIRTGQPAVVNNIARDQNLAPWHEYCVAYGLCAVASLPVRFRGEVAGVFTVVAGEVDVFHAEEVNLLAEIAVDISFALDALDTDDKRQKAENELFTSRERYRSVFENMLDGFCHLQLVYTDGKVHDAVYLEVNPAFERLTGLQKIVGKKISEVMSGLFQLNQEFLMRLERVAQTGKSERYEEYRPQVQKWLSASVVFLSNEQVIILFDETTARHLNEERLLHSLQAANAIAWENNMITGAVKQVGDLAAVFGHPPGHQHASREAFLNDVHPDDRARVEDSWRTMSPGNNYRQLEFRVCLPGGGVRWLSSTGTADFDNTGRVITLHGITRDVTDAKQREQLLQEREAQYRLLADHAWDIIALVKPDGIPIYVSPSYYRLTGWKPEEVDVAHWRDRVHPDDLANVEKINAVNLRGETTRTEHRMLCKDGSWLWLETDRRPILDTTGHVGKIIVASRNITARKQAEAATAAHTDLFRRLFDGFPDAMFIEDSDGTILDVNPAGCRLHGLAREKLIGLNVVDMVPSERREQVAAAFRQWFATGLKEYEGVSVNLANGRETRIDVRGTVLDDQGRSVALLIVRDIEQRKLNEQELVATNRQLSLALTQLRDAQKQLVAQERLRALGQMASGIAHDFNNALTPIIGFADLLLQHPDWVANRDRLQHYIRLIHHSAQDAAQIVRRLHEFHRRRRSGEVFLPLQLNALVKDTIELTAPRWRQQMQAAGVTIAIQTDFSEVPMIHGNEAELSDALTSLIFNAVDSMPQGGTVTIRTVLDGSRVRLEVADNSAGMNAEARQHCFEPFYTTNGEHGAGLGLALVHGIIRRHEGDIAVESEPGVGTTFTIHLPLTISQHTPTHPTGAELPAGKAHILLVDDEPQLREVLMEFLKVDHHHV